MPAQEKTEKATPKKRRDERKEGNVFQSKDVSTVLFLLVAFTGLQAFFPYIYEQLVKTSREYIGYTQTITDLDVETIGQLSQSIMARAATMILPLALIVLVTGILGTGIQTKFLFTSKVLKPKLSKLNPIEGVKKIFALKNFVELIKNLIKVAILIAIVYTMLVDFAPIVLRTMDMDINDSVVMTFDMIMSLVNRVIMVFIVVAIIDYMFQRWEYERKIKMTKQEIKEEYKQTEGNPQIKGKIKEMQRVRARSRMMQAVPSADVIIRNPTHYAVALVYNTEKNRAPVVVAKGQDELALRIIKIAEENNVSVIENKPLARGIYASTEINREIPEEFYGAVAEILVYVYKLNNKLR